jgi:hypothetical protein
MKKRKSASEEEAGEGSPSELIDARIKELSDWRGETLARVRGLIKKAVPDVVEAWKWRGVPVWEHGGIICTGETYKDKVKLTFAKGASLKDPSGLFNSSLEGNARRAIDFHEGDPINAAALQALFRDAAALNAAAKSKSKSKSGKKASTKTEPDAEKARGVQAQKSAKDGVVLLSGGNPQIAKADGDAPVQAYIAAMPGWKSGLGSQLDALIVRTVPDVRKAVRWNSPFYGVEGQGWFLSFHVLTKYVKVTFFAGTSLQPVPPGGTERSKESRWIDIYEDDELDEAQIASWVKQAAALPGWIP